MRKQSKLIFPVFVLTYMLVLAMAVTSFAATKKAPKNKYSATVVVRVRNLDPNLTESYSKITVKKQSGTKITQNLPKNKSYVSHGVSADYKEVYRKIIRWEGSKAHITVKVDNPYNIVKRIICEENSGAASSTTASGSGAVSSSPVETFRPNDSRRPVYVNLSESETMYVDIDAENAYKLKVKSTGVRGAVDYEVFLKQKNGKWVNIWQTGGFVPSRVETMRTSEPLEITYTTEPEAIAFDNTAFPLQFKITAKAVNSSYKAKKSEQIITIKPAKKNVIVKKTVTFRFYKKK